MAIARRLFHTRSWVGKNPYFFYDLQGQNHTPEVKSPRLFDPLSTQPSEPMDQRIKKVFGELGSREESRKSAQLQGITVAGIKVPSRPEEPTNCCMSGCVNCVWELYKDEMVEWKEIRNKAKSVLLQPQYRHVKWPPLLGPEPKDRNGSSRLENEKEEEDDGLGTGINVFIQTEKKLQARKQARQQAS